MPNRDDRSSLRSGAGLPAASSAHDRKRWARTKAVFFQALERPRSDRVAYVQRACADDPDLLREVASLLASEQAAASFCETPAVDLLGVRGFTAPPSGRLQPGTRLGAYEIVAFLSAGGMGEVYRAVHTVLRREVAIKTVHADSAGADANRRLIREARHASTLGHPNICTIYEVGDSDGAPFIVMALVVGRPLSEILETGAPSLDDALDYGIQVASALEHAHRHRIVHRDLKSSNVMVDSDGRAIVLDFGLAKRLPQVADGLTGDSTVTVGGMLAGTLSHMAPEVLLGRKSDSRSDIWSLGVLLYELATGRLPFQGDTPFETSSAILNEPPRPMNGGTPLALRLVIERCLHKDPDARYQTVTHVREALEVIRRRRAWPLVGKLLLAARRRAITAATLALLLLVGLTAGATWVREQLGALESPGLEALTVLPLENATGDPEADYYAAGLTDALSGQLGAATGIRLIALAGEARAEAASKTPAEVGRALGVEAVIAGRLHRSSDRIAVDIQVIEPQRGRVLWSDRFERPGQQVLALQSDVVRAIAAEIRLTLRPESMERLATVRAVNPEAYEAFLKGRFEWNQRTEASLERAIGYFTKAIELDPTYAPAHAALADCYNQFGTVMVGTGSPREYRPRAAAAAIRALQIDPYSAEAHAALAYVRHYDWQWEEAEKGFRRAIELNPSFALARIWYANFLMSRGRMDEALEQVYAARELDPFSLVVNTNVAWVLAMADRHEDALAQLDRTLALDSTYVQARMRRIDALLATARHTEAREEAERLVASTGDWPPAVITLANVHASTGEADAARALLTDLVGREGQGYVAPGGIAGIYAKLGDIEEALWWYGRAIDERSNAVAYLRLDPEAGPLQRDPRFRKMIAAAGLL